MVMRSILIIICLGYCIEIFGQTFNFPSGGINNNTTLCVQTNVTGLSAPNPSFGLEKITLNINHSAVQELKITLKNPKGDIIRILNYNEASGSNLTNTVFQKGVPGIPTINTGTAPYTANFRIMPPDSLGTMNITPDLNGTWELCIEDTDFAGNVNGFLISASLTFGNQPAIPPKCVANFTANPLTGCAPLEVKFQDLSQYATTIKYDFGDLSFSTSRNPLHTYTNMGSYTVIQTLTQNGFSVDTIKKVDYIVVDEPIPQPNFTVDTLVCTPASVTVTNTSIGGVSFEWNFDNGDISALPNPGTVVYSTPGTYDIRLVAFNSVGCSDTISKKIRIIPKPTASFTINQRRGCVPFTVNFTNQSNQGQSYEWDFGDGNISTEVNPSHTYTTSGKYKIMLTVKNEICTDFFEDSIEVFLSPNADFIANPTYVDISSGASADIVFNAQLSSTGTVLWNFGDGNTSTELNPTHTYKEGGRYDVSLTFTDTVSNCSVVVTKKEYIFVDTQENIFVPTAFTPNNDGNNDVFEIKTSGVNQIKVLIFNRWGEKIFENEGNTKYWNGENAPEGVYSYVITGKGVITHKNLSKAGTVTLIR